MFFKTAWFYVYIYIYDLFSGKTRNSHKDLTKNFLELNDPPRVRGRGIHEGLDIQWLPRLEISGIRGTTKAATRSEADQRVPWFFKEATFGWLVGWLVRTSDQFLPVMWDD